MRSLTPVKGWGVLGRGVWDDRDLPVEAVPAWTAASSFSSVWISQVSNHVCSRFHLCQRIGQAQEAGICCQVALVPCIVCSSVCAFTYECIAASC